jgi:hypothetical protein
VLNAQAALATALWCGSTVRSWSQYRRALERPGSVQQVQLFQYLRENARTIFGCTHGFDRIRTIAEYQERVPLSTYDDYTPCIQRIMNGERHVLTRSRVKRLTCSSGSTAAMKLLPCTRRLQQEFARAVGAWMFDLYRRCPELARGVSYWSITPAGANWNHRASVVPIGFDEDAGYLGGWLSRLVSATLAVPKEVRLIDDVESFRYVTLLFLLKARDLRLISVWHPSFLILLLGALRFHWPTLLDDLRAGTLSPPSHLSPPVRAALLARFRPEPQRAAEVDLSGPDRPQALWPALRVISCWGDGHAAVHLNQIRQLFPEAILQAKGLIATEAIVSVPFAEGRPVAVQSHFFEFLDEAGRPRLVHEIEPGASYSVVVTTGGGLYRYRLADRVEVDGYVDNTPSLRFLGKEDHISDLVGEKLSDGFVASVLRQLFDRHVLAPRFAMLAPERRGVQPAYVLILELDAPPPADLAGDLEWSLRANPHYAHSVDLGQLGPVRILRVASGAYATHVAACRALGQRLGDVKPAALSTQIGWAERFSIGESQTRLLRDGVA